MLISQDEVRKEACRVSEAMCKHGTRFERALGNLILASSPDDMLMIQAMWPEIWRKHLKKADEWNY